jgi:hypothetical protein
LEQIEMSPTAPDGQIRTQTFVKRRGSVLQFGSRVLTRVGRGYEMTTTTQDGRLEQTVFVRSTAGSVNSSIVALSASVNHKRVQTDLQSAAAELRTYGVISADDSRRLARAQLEVASAAAELRKAQLMADRLSAVARQAHSEANAKIDEPGVSFQQNQARLAALNAADAAEQNAVLAQHAADVAGTALSTALADVTALQTHLAQVSRLTRALAARVSSPAVTGR